MLAGIYQPTAGKIETKGKIVPFIELGVGFNPELTGRENVYLNGALLGFSREEIDERYNEIVEFAELGEFMEQKLKNYSSGMQVRLAFSMAIQAGGDVMIFDEVLAVGDEAFQRKCNDYFDQIKKDKSKTVVLVTHSMEAVRKYCTRVILIRDGVIGKSGGPDDVASEYSLENLQVHGVSDISDEDQDGAQSVIKDFKVELLSPQQMSQTQKLRVRFSYNTANPIETRVRMDLADLDRGVPIASSGSELQRSRKVSLIWSLDLSDVNNSNIGINASIYGRGEKEILAFLPYDQSPKFCLRRTDYQKDKTGKPMIMTYSIKFDRGEWE
jgi:ABC-2 type transport system ATP-binding protein